MARSEGIGELRSQPIHVVLSMNAHLTLTVELVLERQVLLIPDGLAVLSYKTAQHMELVFEFAVLRALHLSLLREMIALNLQVFNFTEQIVDADGCLERVRPARERMRCVAGMRYFNFGRREASFARARSTSVTRESALLGLIAKCSRRRITSRRKRL